MAKANTTDSDKWNTIYRSDTIKTVKAPAYVLQQFQFLLPQQGTALDLACGLGANALLLAQHGLQTHAWDISSVAIKKLTEISRSLELNIHATARDIISNPPPQDSFDVIVVSHFLERKIMPDIIAALHPNGLLFYQTFCKQSDSTSAPSNKAYLLHKNELIDLCKELHIVVYQESGLVINSKNDLSTQALLIGQRSIGDEHV